MDVDRRKIVIIGGGAVGPKAASRARRLDPNVDIKLIEKGEFISYGACGLPYFVSGVIPNSSQLLARSPDYFKEQLEVDVLTQTTAASIDRNRRLVHCSEDGGKEFSLPYDALVISTGADPVISGKTAGNDMTKISAYGKIPSINWGPVGGPFGYRHGQAADPEAEGFDEYVDLSSFHTLTKLYALTILDWCGIQET